MWTLGVDLASAARNTATCMLSWTPGRATVEDLQLGADDEAILVLAERADATGIDAPFGWPDPFRDMLQGADAPGPWRPERRDVLRFRRTDFVVRERTGRWPLSVSSDLVAVVAMRCDGLLRRLGVEDRAGNGRVFEVYPAAALSVWGLSSRGYKGRDRRAALAEIVDALLAAASWLEVDTATERALRGSDDLLDALVAALIARAAKLGRTAPPPAADRARARREGWIAVPCAGSLAGLGP